MLACSSIAIEPQLAIIQPSRFACPSQHIDTGWGFPFQGFSTAHDWNISASALLGPQQGWCSLPFCSAHRLRSHFASVVLVVVKMPAFCLLCNCCKIRSNPLTRLKADHKASKAGKRGQKMRHSQEVDIFDLQEHFFRHNFGVSQNIPSTTHQNFFLFGSKCWADTYTVWDNDRRCHPLCSGHMKYYAVDISLGHVSKVDFALKRSRQKILTRKYVECFFELENLPPTCHMLFRSSTTNH